MVVIALIFVLSGPTHASTTYRCPDGMIRLGDSRSIVAQRCGEPADIDFAVAAHPIPQAPRERTPRTDRGVGRNAIIHLRQEVWTYNFGPHTFLREVHFLNGRVQDVRPLKDYGWHSNR
jgi:hypothetical protein